MSVNDDRWDDADIDVECWDDQFGRRHFRLLMAAEGEPEPVKMVLNDRQNAFNCMITFLIGRRHFDIVRASRAAQVVLERAIDS